MVNLITVRVFGCTGTGFDSDVIKGVEWVTANASGPSVANMSLSFPPSLALDAAVRYSIVQGISYTVAAGNGGADACGASPAGVGDAITVGSIDRDDNR